MARGGNSAMRAAASSMPSGSPSSRRQISMTAGGAGREHIPGAYPRARSTNRRTASDDSASAWRIHPQPMAVPQRADRELLLEREPQGSPARDHDAQAPRGLEVALELIGRGEQLFVVVEDEQHRTSARNVARRSSAEPACMSIRPRVAAIAAGTSSGSSVVSRRTSHAPSGTRSAQRRASSIAKRVLPVPPGPVRVTRRASSNSASSAANSRSRPTKVVSRDGRLPVGWSAACSGGKSDGRPSTTSWWIGSARSMSRSRCPVTAGYPVGSESPRAHGSHPTGAPGRRARVPPLVPLGGRQPDVVVPAEPADAGVQPHSDANGRSGGPWLAAEDHLRLRRRGHCRGRLGEHHEEQIALRPALRRAVPTEGLAKDRVVALEDLREDRRAQVLDEPGRALHVREQEGHRPGRERPFGHPPSSIRCRTSNSNVSATIPR